MAANLAFVELLQHLLALRLLILLSLHHLVIISLLLHHFLLLLLLFTLVIQLALRTAGSLEDFVDLFHALILEVALDLEDDGLAVRDCPLKFIAGGLESIELLNSGECSFDEATSEDTGLELAVKLIVDLIKVCLLLELDLLVFSGGKLFLYFFLELDALFPRPVDKALALVEEDALLRHHFAQRHLQVILEAILELQTHVIGRH